MRLDMSYVLEYGNLNQLSNSLSQHIQLLQNSDLFGGDSDSDPDTHHSPVPSPHGSHTSDQIDCTRPYSPDGDSQPAKKKKKMKEKTGRERKPKRLKKTEVQQIHSDSQRMVRGTCMYEYRHDMYSPADIFGVCVCACVCVCVLKGVDVS